MESSSALGAFIEASALGQMARASLWLYPAANIVHVLGAALMVGAIVTFDVAVLRGAPAARAVVRAGLPVAAIGLLLLIVSGIVLFSADAGPLLHNPAFLLKLAVIGLGLLNIALFHLVFSPYIRRGTRFSGARPYAFISLVCWTLALLLGRGIAYV